MKKNKELKESIKLLKQFMNLNRKQQLEVIKKLERKLKDDICT